MLWTVTYHKDVMHDLDQLGRAEARRVLKIIEERIINGEPDKTGKPLHGPLAGFRRIRVGDIRIIYRVNGTQIVLIVCVGPRRDDEVYEMAMERV